MRCLKLLLPLLLLGLWGGHTCENAPAQAEVVYCSNCGTEYTQLFNKLQLVKQLETQARQLQQMLTNASRVGQSEWGETYAKLQQAQQLFNESKALVHNALNLEQQFRSKYAGYQQYVQQQPTRQQMAQKYAQWSEESRDNVLKTLKAAGIQSNSLAYDQAVMQRLQNMSQSAEGHMQALQVGHMMAAQQVRQIQELRQLLTLQLQMQANYLAQQQDKEELARAQRVKYFRRIPATVHDNKSF